MAAIRHNNTISYFSILTLLTRWGDAMVNTTTLLLKASCSIFNCKVNISENFECKKDRRRLNENIEPTRTATVWLQCLPSSPGSRVGLIS